MKILYKKKNEKSVKLTEAPKEIRGVQLTEEQHKRFSQGKPIYLEGLESKNGKTYNAYFTFNQEKGKVDVSFKNPEKQDISKDLQTSQTKASKSQKEQTSQTQKEEKTQKQGQKETQKATKTKGRKM